MAGLLDLLNLLRRTGCRCPELDLREVVLRRREQILRTKQVVFSDQEQDLVQWAEATAQLYRECLCRTHALDNRERELLRKEVLLNEAKTQFDVQQHAVAEKNLEHADKLSGREARLARKAALVDARREKCVAKERQLSMLLGQATERGYAFLSGELRNAREALGELRRTYLDEVVSVSLAELRPHELAQLASEVTSVDTALHTESLRGYFAAALQKLSPVERTVLQRRFGLDGADPQTQAQIARELGISKGYVQQLEDKAMKKLRRPHHTRYLQDYLVP